MNEERLVNIEIKIARQEDLVETLNRQVYEQQKKLDELTTLCTAMARRIGELTAANDQNPINERPPHY
jgi:SlyX protein